MADSRIHIPSGAMPSGEDIDAAFKAAKASLVEAPDLSLGPLFRECRSRIFTELRQKMPAGWQIEVTEANGFRLWKGSIEIGGTLTPSLTLDNYLIHLQGLLDLVRRKAGVDGR